MGRGKRGIEDHFTPDANCIRNLESMRKNGEIRINLSDPNYAEPPFPVSVFERTNHEKQKASSTSTLNLGAYEKKHRRNC